MSSHQTISGTFTAAKQLSAGAFYLRNGETASVTLTMTGAAQVSLVSIVGSPPTAYVPLQVFTSSQSSYPFVNDTGGDLYLALSCDVVGGGVTYTLADVAGDQILQEWRAADGTLAFRVTDEGPIGVPSATDLANRKIVVIAGTLRQSSDDRTQWFWIGSSEVPEYSAHVPTGVERVYDEPTGNLVGGADSLTIFYDQTFPRTISLIVTPDETLAREWGATFGASVGLSSAIIRGSIRKTGAGRIRWDGAAWSLAEGFNQEITPTFSYSAASGTLTVSHAFCPGADLMLMPDTADNTLTPYLPLCRFVSNDSWTMQFMDPTTGTIVTGAESTQMSFRYVKQYAGPFRFNGTNGFDAVPASFPGNLWVLGVMDAGE